MDVDKSINQPKWRSKTTPQAYEAKLVFKLIQKKKMNENETEEKYLTVRQSTEI